MDFRVDEDQQALRDGIRGFCEGRVPIERLRDLEQTGGFDPELWRDLAEMGVFGLRLPESRGGVGLGAADAALVFTELGRALVPGPLAWSHLAAGLIDGAGDGSTVVGGLDLLDGVGSPHIVEHLDRLDALLVLREEGVYRLAPDSLDALAIATPLDPLTPVWEVARFPMGEQLADGEAAKRLRDEGAILAAGQLLGIAEATLDMAVAYSKQRKQFNRVIGSFQAVKHMLADGFVRKEAARAAVYAAGATMDDPVVGDVPLSVSSAKANAGEAAWMNARMCIQVHGGMGFTWEVPAHYFLKRAWTLETVFGTSDEHRDRAATIIGSP